MSAYLSLVIAILIIIPCKESHASAAVARRKQMAEMQQQAVQQAYAEQQAQQIQQYQAAQQQAAEQQAYMQMQQQMVAQVQQQQMQAAAQQMVQQLQQKQVVEYVKNLRQQQAQVAQAVQQRKMEYTMAQEQAMVAALTAKYQQEVVQQAIAQKMAMDAAQMAQIRQMVQAKAEAEAYGAWEMERQAKAFQEAQARQAAGAQDRPFEPGASNDIQDIVDITDVWRKLDTDSRPWTLMIDNQAKVATIAEFIERFSKQKVKILGQPIDYVHLVDELAVQNPSLLTRPFKDVLQLVAIMNYDFDNGMDRDALAKKMLGLQLYESNKRRLGR